MPSFGRWQINKMLHLSFIYLQYKKRKNLVSAFHDDVTWSEAAAVEIVVTVFIYESCFVYKWDAHFLIRLRIKIKYILAYDIALANISLTTVDDIVSNLYWTSYI